MTLPFKLTDKRFRAPAAASLVILLDAIAVFFNGAYFIGPLTLCTLGAWAVLAAMTFTDPDEVIALSRMEALTTLVLAAFWTWTGISISWSLAPDLSWIEFNRSGAYFAVFFIGLLVGRHRYATILSAGLFVALAGIAATYSLGAKIFPDHIENLDNLARIAIPLGYTNALGLLTALAVPLAIFFAATGRFAWYLRLLAVMVLPLLLVCLFFTLSRGAILALGVGLMVYFLLVPLRLKSFFVSMLAGIPVFFISFWSSGQDALMQDRMGLAERMAAAADLRIYLLLGVLAAGGMFSLALIAGSRISFSARSTRILGATVVTVLFLSVVSGAAFFISSKPSFSGWAADSYRSLRSSPQEAGAGRLFEFGLSSRWRLWDEAVANWEEHPLIGTGGQSFPLVHLKLKESNTPFVKQPHGLPFRLLTELGIVGALLGASFIALSLTGSLLNWCRACSRWEKGLTGALIATAIVYLVRTSYDWDWNMPALTMMFFFFSGILLGFGRYAGRGSRPEPGSGSE